MNCDKPAVALLTFAPPEAKAWLYDLETPDPAHGITLCRHHANATVVPMSWQLIDARDPAWPGPVGSQAPVQAMSAASAEEFLPSSPSLAAVPTSDHNLSRAVMSDDQTSMSRSVVSAEDILPARLHELPSDSLGIEEEFAALQADLPVTPTRYADSATSSRREIMIDATDEPDPSLFELPFTDAPAVTPHPGY